MKRLFLSVFLGLIIAMLLTGWAISFIVSKSFEARVRVEPPPLGNEIAALTTELLSRVPVDERQAAVDELSAKTGMPMRLLDVSEATPEENCPYRKGNVCWGQLDERIPPFDRSISVILPDGDQIVEIARERRMSPWTADTWLLIIGTMVMVAIGTGVILSFPMVRRLKRVQNAAEQIESGDLSARADVKSGDAVGSFAARFNKMADKLQALLEGQSQLTQAVAHELRTPLARLRFGVEMMAAANDAAERERREFEMVNDLEELDHLVEELLLLIKYDARGTSLVRAEFLPEEAIKSQVEKARPLHPEKAITVKMLVPANLQLVANEKSFQRVARNLISNALRYARAQVLVTLSSNDDSVLLEVADDGPGIPLEERKKVLEPFYRLDRSRSRDSGGVGLGLTIVERIMRAHGGKLLLLDSVEGGTLARTEWPSSLTGGKSGRADGGAK